MKTLSSTIFAATCVVGIVCAGCVPVVPLLPHVRVHIGNIHIGGQSTDDYKGVPFNRKEGPQRIPGKVMCAWYDVGGEGVTYHDTTPENMGDGSLMNGFRTREGVDIGYTTSVDEADNSEFNFVEPPMDMPYIASTEPGEWTKYTVRVEKAGSYAVRLLHTTKQVVEVSFNMKFMSFWGNSHGLMRTRGFVSPHRDDDPVEWRRSHHWNVTDFGEVVLKKGKYILTLETPTVSKGGINYGWLEFELLGN